MENKFQYIECDGVQIAVSIESESSEEHPIFYPGNVLFYMERGQLNIRQDQALHVIPAGSFALARKYTQATCFKSWTKAEGRAVMYAIILQDQFIQAAIRDLGIGNPVEVGEESIFLLPKNQILTGLFKSLATYLAGKEDIDKQLVALKTKEALLGILESKPEYVSLFTQFSRPERADLGVFLEHNYPYNVPLSRLAQMSGRSLSTFNRECKALFGETPHRWIMKRRLKQAHDLLVATDKKASDIYLEIGFEDLAHFSRSFKKEFGSTPTEIKRKVK